jgi:hypothetical protein
MEWAFDGLVMEKNLLASWSQDSQEEFRMWTANYINDPYNDFEITLELLCNEIIVGVIQQAENGDKLELIWYEHDKALSVPVDWLIDLLNDAKRDLKKYDGPADYDPAELDDDSNKI